MVCKPNPAAFSDLGDLGARDFAFQIFEISHIRIVNFRQFAIGHRHGTFVQNEKVFHIGRFAMPRQRAIRLDHRGACATVDGRLRDAKEIVFINCDLPAKSDTDVIAPNQPHW